MKRKTKAILIDVLGFTLVLAAAPIGWLPGPGGIAVLILGLSLLATNHEWAERIMNRVKRELTTANQKVSEADPLTKWAIDIFGILFIIIAVFLVTQFTQSLAKTSAISFVIVGISLLLTNRNRHKAVLGKFKRKHKR